MKGLEWPMKNFRISPAGVVPSEVFRRREVIRAVFRNHSNFCVEETPHPHPSLASVPQWF